MAWSCQVVLLLVASAHAKQLRDQPAAVLTGVKQQLGKLNQEAEVKGLLHTIVEEEKSQQTLEEFLPACLAHLRRLITTIDRSYTDVQLGHVLSNECELAKEFPHAYKSGYTSAEACHRFSDRLVDARYGELKNGGTDAYKEFCTAYFTDHGHLADLPLPSDGKTTKKAVQPKVKAAKAAAAQSVQSKGKKGCSSFSLEDCPAHCKKNVVSGLCEEATSPAKKLEVKPVAELPPPVSEAKTVEKASTKGGGQGKESDTVDDEMAKMQDDINREIDSAGKEPPKIEYEVEHVEGNDGHPGPKGGLSPWAKERIDAAHRQQAKEAKMSKQELEAEHGRKKKWSKVRDEAKKQQAEKQAQMDAKNAEQEAHSSTWENLRNRSKKKKDDMDEDYHYDSSQGADDWEDTTVRRKEPCEKKVKPRPGGSMPVYSLSPALFVVCTLFSLQA